MITASDFQPLNHLVPFGPVACNAAVWSLEIVIDYSFRQETHVFGR
jgi:hypothetical protein